MENNFNTPAQVFEANMKAGEGKVRASAFKMHFAWTDGRCIYCIWWSNKQRSNS